MMSRDQIGPHRIMMILKIQKSPVYGSEVKRRRTDWDSNGFSSREQSRNKGGASGALAPGVVNVGAQN
jgi:hypothetical protein